MVQVGGLQRMLDTTLIERKVWRLFGVVGSALGGTGLTVHLFCFGDGTPAL